MRKTVSTDWVSLSVLLRYLFRNNPDEVSLTLTKDIETYLTQTSVGTSQPDDTVESVYDIYRDVAKLKFSHEAIARVFTVTSDVFECPTLYDVHKHAFSETEWYQIRLFEWHFGRIHGNTPRPISIEIEKRRQMANILKKTMDISLHLQTTVGTVLKDRAKRQSATTMEAGMVVDGRSRHFVHAIDSAMLKHLSSYFPDVVNNLVTVPLEDINTVSVFIECRETTLPEHLQELVGIATQHHLNSLHQLSCKYIAFVKPSTFTKYEQKNIIARFSLHDDLMIKKQGGSIISQWSPTEQTDTDDTQGQLGNCSFCYSFQTGKPLTMDSFDIVREWVLDVPLTIQILLQSFLKIIAINRSIDQSTYLKHRIEKLYSIFDLILNVTSKNHFGVHQQANTQELMMNSKCVSTLFKVTSAAGITTSLKEAANRVEEKALPDIGYYKTYIKPYQMTYATEAGEVTKDVNLRQCHIILMIDNLVRLKFHRDPDPGESRSMELDTLPITLQGLPIDSLDTASWHARTCNGTTFCTCMGSNVLRKEDAMSLLLDLRPEEAETSTQFRKLCTWGLPNLIHHLTQGKNLQLYINTNLINFDYQNVFM